MLQLQNEIWVKIFISSRNMKIYLAASWKAYSSISTSWTFLGYLHRLLLFDSQYVVIWFYLSGCWQMVGLLTTEKWHHWSQTRTCTTFCDDWRVSNFRSTRWTCRLLLVQPYHFFFQVSSTRDHCFILNMKLNLVCKLYWISGFTAFFWALTVNISLGFWRSLLR